MEARLGLERVEVAVDGRGHGNDGGGHAARRKALGEGGGVGGRDGPPHEHKPVEPSRAAACLRLSELLLRAHLQP